MEITYEEFINNILETRGRFACGDEYHETHHIIPKCMGGTNDEDNLIDLFAREHYEAHRLLVLENPNNHKLAYAWSMMARAKKDGRNYQISPQEYEEAKIAFSKAHTGHIVSQETKNKQSDVAVRRCNNEEYKKWFSQFQKELWGNPEYKAEMIKKINLNFESLDIKRKMSENHANVSGENNPFFGKTHSEESKKKISKSKKELYKDPEMRRKISESRIGIMVGSNHPESKIVLCCDTMTIYGAVSTASKELDINSNNICSCCVGERKHAGGFSWRYLYDQTRKDGAFIPGAITLGFITEEEALQQLNNQCIDKSYPQ